jgi:aromatic-L-amino-acid/L-tryptophan decarboxylase
MKEMSPEEFRRLGHELVDWTANYLADPGRYPVLPSVAPGDLIDALPASGPERGESMPAILADFERLILPATTHWNHPGFMAYFANSSTGPGVLGELLTAVLNVNGMIWKSSPAATELEQVTLAWLLRWMGLPSDWFGIIFDTASTSTMHALAAARQAADPEARLRGASGNLALYASELAHSSVEKGAIAIGIGQNNVRKICCDAAFRMRPDLLEAAILLDRANGLRPFCVVPTVGTTSATSIDPVPEIAAIAARHGLWMHVDAAYGGAAAIVPELRQVLLGAEHADSLVVNPHKWLLTPLDLSVLYTRHPATLKQAFSLVPDYLQTTENPRAVNFMDYGIPLGRRFRALKLWFVMRYYGREGLAEVIRGHVACAREFSAWIEADPRFELCAPVPLSLVCFRVKGTDDENRKLLERVNASGEVFLSHTALDGRFTLRLAIGNIHTGIEHVRRAWEKLTASL